jgi:uncharacterized membrane protein
MRNRTADILSIAMIAFIVAFTAYCYPNLPDQIPTHWNTKGQVDDYTAKPWGAIIFPAMSIAVLLIMKLIPVISPRGFRTDEFRPVVNVFQVTLVAFTAGIGALALLEALGYQTSINRLVFAGTGLLLIIIGNFMGKVRKNFFLGIRTPWTLASDEVWSRTHRLGGRMLMLGGAIMVLNAIIPLPIHMSVLAVVALALIPVAYSYILYRRLEGFGPDAPIEDELGGKRD